MLLGTTAIPLMPELRHKTARPLAPGQRAHGSAMHPNFAAHGTRCIGACLVIEERHRKLRHHRLSRRQCVPVHLPLVIGPPDTTPLTARPRLVHARCNRLTLSRSNGSNKTAQKDSVDPPQIMVPPSALRPRGPEADSPCLVRAKRNLMLLSRVFGSWRSPQALPRCVGRDVESRDRIP